MAVSLLLSYLANAVAGLRWMCADPPWEEGTSLLIGTADPALAPGRESAVAVQAGTATTGAAAAAEACMVLLTAEAGPREACTLPPEAAPTRDAGLRTEDPPSSEALPAALVRTSVALLLRAVDALTTMDLTVAPEEVVAMGACAKETGELYFVLIYSVFLTRCE